MEYRTLGRTGATVSHLGFGGAVLGLTDYLDRFDPLDAEDRRRMLAAIEIALEGGVNLFDTAPGYGDGASDRVLGEALDGVRASNGHPLFLSSKVGLLADGTSVRASLEGTLERLRRDRIDLLQIHGSSYSRAETDQVLGAGGMVEQLLALRDEGLVRFIGFTSEDNNDSVYRLIHSGQFDTMQICYNLLFQHPYEASRPFGSLLAAEAAGMGTLAMRVATSGTFQRWLAAVNPANTFDYTPALIQFVLSNPHLDVALVGMRTPDEVRQNLDIVDDVNARIDLDRLFERYVSS